MTLQPQIHLKNRKTGEKRRYRMDQSFVAVGRDLSNFIVLESRLISRRHAEILQEESQFFLKDLRSHNGTFLNEKRLPPMEKALLRSGDLIRIEEFELHFHLPAPGEVEDIYETTDTDLLEIKMIKKLLKAMDRESAPSLEVLEGPEAGKRFVFEGKNQEITIGRDPSCEFQINSDVISRRHVRIEKHLDTLVLHDLKSKNGTYVNRERIQEKTLKDGDILHLGTLPLTFRNPQELVFDLAPPQIKKDEKEEAKGMVPIPTGPEARVAGRREGEPLVAESEEVPAEEVPSFKLGPSEILVILLGGLVLIGSIWGILKLLK